MDTTPKPAAALARSRVLALARGEMGLTSIVAMAVAGLAISAYLTAVHYANVPLACPTTGVINCQAVTSSAYSLVPGTTIPITLPGMLWFVVSGALAGTALARAWQGRSEMERLRVAQLLWGAAGLLFVLYLVYAEIVVLHKICEWCTVVHLLTFATFLVALKRWQDAPAGSASPRPLSAQTRGSSTTRRSGQPGGRRRTSGRAR